MKLERFHGMTMRLFFQKILGLIRHEVDIENIRTPFGEPFNENNHWVKTLYEYDQGLTDWRESSLSKFHDDFKPITIFDTLKGIDKQQLAAFSFRYPLGLYPWGEWVCYLSKEQWFYSRHCGPSPEDTVRSEWINFINLYKSIKKEGLDWSIGGHPLGYFLLGPEHKKTYVVTGGNHRVAIASHLQFKKVKVRLLARDYVSRQVYRYDDIDNLWRSDDVEMARRLFKSIVSNDFILH